MRGTLLATLSLALAAGTHAEVENPAQPGHGGQLAFAGGVDVVNLNVAVLSSSGDRFVTNLQPQDFIVLEDGVPQEPMIFQQESLPISVVLLLDVSSSMKPRLGTMRRAAAGLIDNLRPEDLAEVVAFNKRPTVLQAFTSDHQKLKEAVGALVAGGTTALHDTLYITLKEISALRKSEGTRRRAIVLLSDGEDTASVVSDDQVIKAARLSEVGVYSILLGSSEASGEPATGQARYLLAALARDSGGQAFFPTSVGELGRLYARIGEELRSQYSIGYISKNPASDGNWRQILVMTPQRSELRVRHRLGYYAIRDAIRPRARTTDAGSTLRQSAAGTGAEP